MPEILTLSSIVVDTERCGRASAYEVYSPSLLKVPLLYILNPRQWFFGRADIACFLFLGRLKRTAEHGAMRSFPLSVAVGNDKA